MTAERLHADLLANRNRDDTHEEISRCVKLRVAHRMAHRGRFVCDVVIGAASVVPVRQCFSQVIACFIMLRIGYGDLGQCLGAQRNRVAVGCLLCLQQRLVDASACRWHVLGMSANSTSGQTRCRCASCRVLIAPCRAQQAVHARPGESRSTTQSTNMRRGRVADSSRQGEADR